MPYTIRVINSLSSDDGSMVDIQLPPSAGRVHAYIAAWAIRLTTGKGVALLESREIHDKPALWLVLILEG